MRCASSSPSPLVARSLWRRGRRRAQAERVAATSSGPSSTGSAGRSPSTRPDRAISGRDRPPERRAAAHRRIRAIARLRHRGRRPMRRAAGNIRRMQRNLAVLQSQYSRISANAGDQREDERQRHHWPCSRISDATARRARLARRRARPACSRSSSVRRGGDEGYALPPSAGDAPADAAAAGRQSSAGGRICARSACANATATSFRSVSRPIRASFSGRRRDPAAGSARPRRSSSTTTIRSPRRPTTPSRR